MVRRWLPGLLSLLLLAAACGDDAAPASTTTTTAAPAPTTTATTTTVPPTTTATTRTPIHVDDLLAVCPTADQIAGVDADLDLVFLADPTAPELVCTAAAGSTDLTRLQERAYQAILVTTDIKFDAPLPWTDLLLYEWLIGSIDGLRFRDDISVPGCCPVTGYLDFPTTNLSALRTLRWIDPQIGTGLDGLVVTIVKMAGLMVGTPFACGPGVDIAAQDSYAADYHLLTWLADHSFPEFLTAADVAPDYYRESARAEAAHIAASCSGG